MFTVENELLYAALLRLPDNWSFERKFERVQEVIDIMNLTDLKHTVIGASDGSGLSGGQKVQSFTWKLFPLF